jgi:hypothetical protein
MVLPRLSGLFPFPLPFWIFSSSPYLSFVHPFLSSSVFCVKPDRHPPPTLMYLWDVSAFPCAIRCLHHHSHCQSYRNKASSHCLAPTRRTLSPPSALFDGLCLSRSSSPYFVLLVACELFCQCRMHGSHVNSGRPSDGSLRSVIYWACARHLRSKASVYSSRVVKVC